jgi:hypothetical protein
MTQGGGVEKRGHRFQKVFYFGAKAIPDFGLDIFVWKVNPRFNSSQKLKQLFSISHQPFAQPSGECSLSGEQGAVGASVKDVQNALRFG